VIPLVTTPGDTNSNDAFVYSNWTKNYVGIFYYSTSFIMATVCDFQWCHRCLGI